MNTNLRNLTAVVCGSTQGIGKATAILLAKMGANLILIARNETSLQKVAQELDSVSVKDAGQKHLTLCCDFNEPEKMKALVEREILSKGTKVDILVNNNGGPPAGPLLEADFAEVEKSMNRLLKCCHILAQLFVPSMKLSGYGRIINIISTSVKEPIQNLGVSNMIRASNASWAKTLAAELGPFQITVNNVLPGFIRTGRLENLVAGKSEAQKIPASQVEESLQREVPLRRFGHVDEVAGLIGFLASPAASYISGTSIPVDGGRLKCL